MTDKANSASKSTAAKSSALRLLSLDALRGFDMFWIVGAEDIVHALHKASGTGFVNLLATQMDHVKWDGVRFYDLIFPLFVFIVGVSMVFSLSKLVQESGKIAALKRIFWRALLLYLVGIFYYGGFAGGMERIRLMGVLQRIALCYFFAGIIFCTFKLRGMIVTCVALLVGYWALMAWVPIRDIQLEKTDLDKLTEQRGGTNVEELFYQTTNTVAGKYDPGLNLANHIDFQYLSGRRWDTYYDPEGLLSTLPAVANCLLGVFAGLLLKGRAFSEQKKVLWLLGAGVCGVLLGFIWGLQFPIIKKIWTSSYVLVAGGYSCIFLAVFYQIIDVWKYQKWAMPFVWIGVNPITIYLAHNFIDFPKLANRLVGGPIKASCGNYGELLVTLVVLAMSFLLVRFLYQRKIFLRL